MLVYLSILAMIPIMALIMKPSQSRAMRLLYVWIVFGALAILAMFRGYTVGVDTNQFVSVYQNIGLNPSFSLDEYRYEPGFTLLCRFLNGISPEPQLLLVVTGAFILFAVGYTVYRLSNDVALSAFMFVAMTTYCTYLNVMRQAVAVGFVLLGYNLYIKHNWIGAIAFFYIATLFHSSAWVVLVAMALTFVSFTKKTLVAYLLVTAVMFVFSNQVTSILATLMGKERFYSPGHSGTNYYGALIILIFTATIVFMCFFYMGVDSDEETNSVKPILYRHILMLWLMFVAMGVKVEVMVRFSYYFGIMSICIVPYALLNAKGKERYWVKMLFCGVCLSYFLIVEICRPEWHGVVPYVMNYDGLTKLIKDIRLF